MYAACYIHICTNTSVYTYIYIYIYIYMQIGLLSWPYSCVFRLPNKSCLLWKKSIFFESSFAKESWYVMEANPRGRCICLAGDLPTVLFFSKKSPIFNRALFFSKKAIIFNRALLPKRPPMWWLRLVGSIKLKVSFAKEPYKRDTSAKETYNLIDPTDRSHPMCDGGCWSWPISPCGASSLYLFFGKMTTFW